MKVLIIYFYDQIKINNILKQRIYLYLYNRNRLLETLLDGPRSNDPIN